MEGQADQAEDDKNISGQENLCLEVKNNTVRGVSHTVSEISFFVNLYTTYM
jgi:hypothetical protein